MPRQVVIVLYMFIFLITVILYLFRPVEYSISLLYATLIMVLMSILLFVVCREDNLHIRKQYFRPVIFFLLGYLIVFFQSYIDLIIGNVDVNNSFLFVNAILINQAGLISCGGLAAFLLGYFMSANQKISKKNKSQKTYSLKWLTLLLFFFLAVFVYYNGENYILGIYSQAYIEGKLGSMAAYSEVLFFAVYLSIIILNCRSCKIRNVYSISAFFASLGWFFHLSLLIYITLVILSGDRGPVLVIILTYFCSFVVATQHKIKLRIIILCVIIGSFLFSLLGIVRAINTDESLYNKLVNVILHGERGESVLEKSFLESTNELATSVRTLHYAISYVPDKHTYLFGSFQVRDFMGGIPFSSSLIAPLQEPHFKYKSSAYFITWIDQGNQYFYGTGSSINADLYLSFGELGVWVGLFLLGILFRRIDIILFSSSIVNISLFELALSFTVVGISIYMSRGTVFGQAYYLTFTFVIIILYDNIMRKHSK